MVPNSSFEIGKRLKILFSLFCIISIQACSDSQLGKKLADSFESPLKSENSNQNPNLSETKDVSSSRVKNKLLESKIKTIKSESKIKTDSLKLKKASSKKKKNNDKGSSVRKTQLDGSNNIPYRIIIRILETNPSAPAEKVTSLLRNSGVIFEVERIERLQKDYFLDKSSSSN